MAKLMLLDGNSLAYRAFFALPTSLALASGQVTNAVFGFTSMLINLLKDHTPDQIAVAFDRPEPTFRHALVADYKAGREAAPDILRQQMGLVRQVVETLKIPIVEAPGFEADDVIATLATEARDRGDEVVVVTGDRDAYQLVEDPLVKVLYNMRGVSDYRLYDEAGIEEKTGVKPVDYPQYAALRGDTSDNLPGVPGVGPKTAAKLINTYGNLDGVFANVEKNTPKLRESLAAHEAQVRRNATATPLVRDVPLEVDLDRLRMGQWDPDAVRELFRFLEFNTLYPRFVEATGAAAPPPVASEKLDVAVRRVGTREEAAKVVAQGGVCLAAAWEGEEGRSPLLGLALVVEGSVEEAHWIPCDLLPEEFGSFSAHNAKALMRALDLRAIDLRRLDLDTAIAAYLLDPAETQYLLEDLALRFLGLDITSPDAPPPGQLDLSGTAPDPAEDAARRALAVARLAPALSKALDSRGLRRLYEEIERPLVRVLARMEKVGVRVDVDLLRRIYDGLVAESARLEEEIQELCGKRFLVNSTLQLRKVLF
ncbi:MAG TPA: 5'-3' exonuclease H3TH domain-containing protein, partial [Acidimicrobiales bacterium]|nr:5'-3' exonuclease H3TH domain-containing protein [Acidimicrobiales bacterium]